MKARASRSAAASLLGILMTLVSAGVANETASDFSDAQPAPGGQRASSRVSRAANRLLAKLDIEEEGPRQGYRRDAFPHWVTQDDGCSTRQRVLIDEREVGEVDGCDVADGEWFSIYDAEVAMEARRLDVDHMVPLAEAWDSGASSWTRQERQAFANDLEYDDALIAVTASSNRSKGDQDPGEWQPPEEEAWCRYATAWTTQKIRWGLTANQTELDSLREMFGSCNAAPSARIALARP